MINTENHFLNQLSELVPDFSLSEHQMQQLRNFYLNLLKWNEVMNLTSITEEEDVYTKHFLDSYSFLLGVPRETLNGKVQIIDVGTGAGFPGIPIAIAFPEAHVTLMDSLNKRINFLKDTCEKIQLSNVSFVHSRAEDLGRNKEYREQYDFVVSRAVANLSTLSEYCIPFVKVGGYFIAYKSEKVNEELASGNRAASILGVKCVKDFSFYLPETDYRRTILSYQKIKSCPIQYPRKAGIPSKSPLGVH